MPRLGGSADPFLMEEVKKYIERQTGTVLKNIYRPTSSYFDRSSVWLNSGGGPDIFLVLNAVSKINSYAIKGHITPLDEYVEQSKILSKVNQKFFEPLKVNGSLYAISESKPIPKIIWTCREIFDRYQVNLSDSPTTEEFIHEMKKIRGSQIIPLSIPKSPTNLQFFYNAFGAYPEFIKDHNGNYFDGFNTPEMKAAIKFLYRLYQEAILDKDFINNDNTSMRLQFISGKSACILDYTTQYFYYYNEMRKPDSKTDPQLSPIYKLVGSPGKGGALNNEVYRAFCISSKSNYPQECVGLLAWLFYTPQGVKLYYLGLEGKHYVIENGIAKPTFEAACRGQVLSMADFVTAFPSLSELNFNFKFPDSEHTIGFYNMTKNIDQHIGLIFTIPSGASSTYDQHRSSLNQKRTELALKMILGILSIEDGFKEYQQFFESINGATIIKELNLKK